jgi:hypothetical protein
VSASDLQLRRWRAPLLWISLGLLAFGTISGAWLFFFGGFMARRETLALGHWILCLLLLAPYAIYQLRHYLRNEDWRGRVHFRLGLTAFFAITALLLSGLPLILWPPGSPGMAVLLADLIHIVASFLLVILLVAHLVLVTRLTLGRRDSDNAAAPPAARAIRLALLVPVSLALATVIALAIASCNAAEQPVSHRTPAICD